MTRGRGGSSTDGAGSEDMPVVNDIVDSTQEFDPFEDDSTGGLPVVEEGNGSRDGTAGQAARKPNVDPTPTSLLPKVSDLPRGPRDWVDLVDHWFPERYRVPTIVTTAVSLALTVAFLFLPLAGTDLSAQVARGHFFQAYGWHTVDFRWYGGVFPFGYSVLAGPLNAMLGSRGVGALSCVVTASAFAWLLARFRVRRPTLGGVLAAMVGVFNLVSGRTTFALGIAIAMLCLVALSLPRAPRAVRLSLGGVLAVGAVAGSPIAGLFLGLAGGALLLAGLGRGHRGPGTDWSGWLRWLRPSRYLGGAWREGLVLCAGALIGVAPTAVLFADGGVQPFTSDSMKVFVAVAVATFFLIPGRYRALRWAAVLTVVMVLGAFYMPSPIGSNVTRLPMLYSAPLVAAVATIDRRLLAGAIVALTWWQPPLVTGDLGNAGSPAAHRTFYDPLISYLNQHGPIGRIEVVPLQDHWESTYVAEAVPIARGWERQVDVQRNAVFYNGSLDPSTYASWLYRNAVSYVALPKHTRVDSYGREEAALIEAGLPYLQQVWEDADWQLYAVAGATQLVSGNGVLVSSGPTGVLFDTTAPGHLTVRVRWSHWLTLTGPDACFQPTDDGWVDVHVNRAGRYMISSGWNLSQAHRCTG
jgi:hypothetical protein